MPIKNIPNLTELLQKATHAQRAAQKELDKTDRCKLFVKNFPISYKEPELKALSKDISAVDIHQNRKGNFRESSRNESQSPARQGIRWNQAVCRLLWNKGKEGCQQYKGGKID
ncbi:hypothetical protein MAR_036655 [Mya arenaria]|uniref:Uncharacterized protein n=1 Tax=Mya arenaria TaxID=6604 RepID=A0ABY7FQI1_MYAAR|nr:hypothetical protein MAR_036655 [Mya arenaria]